MKVAMIGMGRLGLPVALAWATKHDVVGFDVSPHAAEILATKKYPHREPGAQKLLDAGTTLRLVDTVAAAVEHADIVFVAVQTAHLPAYEGLNRMPEGRADFDYEVLKGAVHEVARAADEQKKAITIVVISTCLPGTCRREVYPLLNDHTGFVYAPMFIAQSTVVEDAMKPEFVLLGVDRERDKVASLERVEQFFKEFFPTKITVGDHEYECEQPPHAVMSVPSAELSKVFYNVFLGMKIVAANAGMEIAHKTGANIDDVTRAMAFATDRVASAKYMRGGMGDGGGCHPRDAIALSWLAEQLGLSTDVGGWLIEARERQTEWLAELAIEESRDGKLPIVILGKAYKKGTNLTTGSPAVLLKNILDEFPHLQVHQYDPHVDNDVPPWDETPHVFVVATDHDEFFANTFHPGNIVIDPWGKMQDQPGVKIIRVGRR